MKSNILLIFCLTIVISLIINLFWVNKHIALANKTKESSKETITNSNNNDSQKLPYQISEIDDDYVTLWESPDPKNVYGYTPGLAKLPGGRLIATMDIGGKSYRENNLGYDKLGRLNKGLIFTSDDGGNTWTKRGTFPFVHARPFVAGDTIYIIGQSGDLMIMKSEDEGETWTLATKLTDGERWHQTAANVWHAKGNVYLVMERRLDRNIPGWEVANVAPVLMRGEKDSNLMNKDNWTFAEELVFEDVVDYREINYFGVPFYRMHQKKSIPVGDNSYMHPMGWLESNVVQIKDPDHIWYDPEGNTFHLFLRAHTGATNYAAICKVVEQSDGSMTTELVTAPSGKKMVYIPFPGGQMRFHILYDDKTELYWLLSSQATYSMVKPSKMSEDRFGLPDNERHRLALYFSKDMVNWNFAGLVAKGDSPKEARHYASMVIDGDDLHILSRSGDERAKSAHDGNLITFHTVPNFRKLVY